MATRLMQMKCQNCGANLELDLDNLIAFCPYCGAKLMLDIDQLHQVLIAKEGTKVAKEVTKRDELKYDFELEKKKMDIEEGKRNDKSSTKFIIGCLIFIFIIYISIRFDEFGITERIYTFISNLVP